VKIIEKGQKIVMKAIPWVIAPAAQVDVAALEIS